MNINDFKNKLVNAIASCDKVKGVAQTGDINAPLIAGKSDIDIFVLCTQIPSLSERTAIYEQVSGEYEKCTCEVCCGGQWGYGDILMCEGTEVMPMYFTIIEMREYIESVLDGEHLAREDRFYPVGRLASIESINILYDEDNVWANTVAMVSARPQPLMKKLFDYHMSLTLDEEDLNRTLLRKEVLFYHQVLENSVDHLLIALFALNDVYFPSRKRTEKYIDGFSRKPVDFCSRLKQIIIDGSNEDTIENSVIELKKLINETKSLNCF